MNLTGTGIQVWPLTTGSNDEPLLTPGKPTSFSCSTVPDRCPTGPLANYLPGIIVTFFGQVVQAGGAGAPIYPDRFCGALFESLDWAQCWHGVQVSSNYVKGIHWFPTEFNAMGFRHPLRVRSIVAPAANGTYAFEQSIFVPACSGFGKLFLETMQLALLFRNSQLKINAAQTAALTTMSPGASITNLSARASACLVPRQDLVLGPAIETVLTTVVAGSASPQVEIKNFGTDTQLQGVESGGGVITLLELSSVNDQGGAFACENVVQYNFPWRGQTQSYHPQALLQTVIGALPNDRNQTTPDLTDNTDFVGYPYKQGNAPAAGTANLDLVGMYGWIMAQGGNDLQLTELQTADVNQSYFLQVAGGFGAEHLILGQYARSWQQTMITNWVQQITAGGSGSLAQYVLGAQGLAAAKLGRRTPRTKHSISKDQLRYLPWQLA
jgi:hypothetical protein